MSGLKRDDDDGGRMSFIVTVADTYYKTVVHERLRTPQTRPVTRVVPIFSRLQLYFIYHPSDRNFSQGSDPSVSVYK